MREFDSAAVDFITSAVDASSSLSSLSSLSSFSGRQRLRGGVDDRTSFQFAQASHPLATSLSPRP